MNGATSAAGSSWATTTAPAAGRAAAFERVHDHRDPDRVLLGVEQEERHEDAPERPVAHRRPEDLKRPRELGQRPLIAMAARHPHRRHRGRQTVVPTRNGGPAGPRSCSDGRCWTRSPCPRQASPPGMAGAFSGFSATTASVVRNRAAIDAAFCSAERVTLVGSIDAELEHVPVLAGGRVQAVARGRARGPSRRRRRPRGRRSPRSA